MGQRWSRSGDWRGFGLLPWWEVRDCALVSPILLPSHPSLGDLEKAVTELILDFNTSTEEEGPYEALYNAVSCQSLDSTASGRSSDRDSVSREAEAAGGKAAGVRPVCGRGSAVTSALLGNRGRGVWPPVPAASQRPGPPAAPPRPVLLGAPPPPVSLFA